MANGETATNLEPFTDPAEAFTGAVLNPLAGEINALHRLRFVLTSPDVTVYDFDRAIDENPVIPADELRPVVQADRMAAADWVTQDRDRRLAAMSSRFELLKGTDLIVVDTSRDESLAGLFADFTLPQQRSIRDGLQIELITVSHLSQHVSPDGGFVTRAYTMPITDALSYHVTKIES